MAGAAENGFRASRRRPLSRMALAGSQNRSLRMAAHHRRIARLGLLHLEASQAERHASKNQTLGDAQTAYARGCYGDNADDSVVASRRPGAVSVSFPHWPTVRNAAGAGLGHGWFCARAAVRAQANSRFAPWPRQGAEPHQLMHAASCAGAYRRRLVTDLLGLSTA